MFQTLIPRETISAVFGGPCMHDCRICNVGSGTVDRIGQMLNGYPAFVRNIAHRNSPDIDTNVVYSALVKDDVVSEIDAGRPIVAGISPHSGFLPPGLSEHAVLIVGYEGNGGSIDILVNDPFPYAQAGIRDPYTQVGGKRVVPGRYRISLDAMVSDLAWGNSITGIDTQ